jgi:heparosan-N-sulfate-glucuronate 5-epimerase
MISLRARQIFLGVRELVRGGAWVHGNLQPASLGEQAFGLHEPWYYDLRQSLVRDDYSPFDIDGIPVRENTDGIGQRPILALSFGLAHMTRWLIDDDETSAAKARRMARWVANEVATSPFDSAVVVRTAVPGLAAPWPNALLQGLTLSLLARVNALEPSSSLEAALCAAVRPFGLPIARGGLRDEIDGHTWFEEYPFPGGGSHVLNGFIYSLFGLRDAAHAGNTDAKRFYDEGLASLVNLLPRYATPNWSYYDEPSWGPPRLASLYYQRTHAGLLRAFAHCEPVHASQFNELAARFDRQADRLTDRMRVLVAKRNDGALPSPAALVEAKSDVPDSPQLEEWSSR